MVVDIYMKVIEYHYDLSETYEHALCTLTNGAWIFTTGVIGFIRALIC